MPVVTAEDLAPALARGEVVVLDVQPLADARSCRVVGARHFDLTRVQAPVGPVPDMLLGPDAFAAAASAAGIEPTTQVVVYDGQDGRAAARAFWVFEHFGHQSVRALGGGLNAWRSAGLPTESGELPSPAPSTYTRRGIQDNLATFEDVQAATRDPAVTIVDARSAEEYAQGAIPGAANLDFNRVIAPPPSPRWLRPQHELQRLFADQGVHDPAQPVVVYCRSGARSSVLYLALRSLGYQRASNYDGSWAEWESRHGGRGSAS